MLGAVGYLATESTHLWFFGDDWDFLLHRSVTGGGSGIWAPHNEHWSTLPILAFRLMFHLFGVRQYLPYALMALAVHVVVVSATWLLMVRAGIRPWIATAIGAVMAIMGVGAENTLWDFQIGFMGAVAFGLLAVLALQSSKRPLIWVPIAVLASLMCSGEGLVMLVVVTVFALLSRGWRLAATVGCYGLLVYGSWYAAIGHTGTAQDHITVETVAGVPVVVGTGLTLAWSDVTGLPGAGLIVLAAAAAVLIRLEATGPRSRQPRVHLGAAGLAGAITLYVLSGLTRVQTIGGISPGRYAYIAVILSAPAVAVAVQHVLGESPIRRPLGRGVLGLVALSMVVTGLHDVYQFRQERTRQVGKLAERMVGAVQLAASGQELLGDTPSPHYNPVAELADLQVLGRAGDLPGFGTNEQGVLDAASFLQVRIAATAWGFPSPQHLTLVAGLLDPVDPRGCRHGTSAPGGYLDIVSDGDFELRFTASLSTISTRLVRDGRTSSAAPWIIPPGADRFLDSTAPVGTHVRLVFGHSASFVVCA